MSQNKEIFNKHRQRLFDVLLHNKQKYVDLVINNKTNKYGGKNKKDVERTIDEIIDRGYLNKPANYGENIQDDIVITASICHDIENQMIDKINIVKKVCAELNITQRERAERMGVHQNMPAKWSSGDEPSQMAINFMELLINHEKTKRQLDKFKQGFALIDEAKQGG